MRRPLRVGHNSIYVLGPQSFFESHFSLIVPVNLEAGEMMDPEDQGRDAICPQSHSLPGAGLQHIPRRVPGALLHCRAEKEMFAE